MSLLDRFRENKEVIALREEMRKDRWNVDLIMESMSKVEASMNEEGWRELSSRIRQELTRGGLDNMAELSRAMYIANPLIQRAVNVRAYYTWAQGINVQAEDDLVKDMVLDPLHNDPLNRAEMFGHQAQILTDIDQTCDGNLFTALFTNMRGDVSVRSIPLDEIRQVIRSEDDYAQIQYYRRRWTQEKLNEQTGTCEYYQAEAFYPDINYTPMTKPRTINGYPVRWDAPIIHQRTGGLKKMAFGIPETYAALDWARAYKKFLEDWHSIVASLARFAWSKTTKGSKIQRAKEKLQRLVGDEGEEPSTSERAAAGATHIAVEGDDLKPISKSGAMTSADDAKPSRMMVGSAMDLPDTILSGDPQQGNLATAKTLDRPTELSIVSRQGMWAEYRQAIYAYAIRQRMLRGAGELRLSPNTSTEVAVTFPEILEHDIAETIKALVSAATLDGKSEAGTMPKEQLAKALMEELGFEDVDDLIKTLEQELADQDKAELEQMKAQLDGIKQQAVGAGLV